MTNGNGTMTPSGDAMPGRVMDLLQVEAIWASPPAWVESSILTAISGAQPPAPTERPATPRRRNIPLLAGAGALLVALILWLGLGARQPADQDTVFDLLGTDLAASPEGTATVRPTDSGWYIHIDVTGLPPAPDGTYYEGWVYDGINAVSIGTFHMRGGDGTVVLWAGVNLRTYPELWITLQEEGGGYAPSQDVYLKGRASDLE